MLRNTYNPMTILVFAIWNGKYTVNYYTCKLVNYNAAVEIEIFGLIAST